MPIDWFTVVAQIVNFLILVWLLKRFLYKPILDAIDAREKRIADQLTKANASKEEAQKQRDDFERKIAIFDQEQTALMKKATEAAQAERSRLLEVARKEADALTAKRRDAFEAEKQGLREAITRRTQQEVFSLARKTMQDLASVGLEKQMCDVLIERVRSLDEKVISELIASTQTTTQSTRVRSAFDLPSEQRSQIQAALNESLNADVQIQFETDPSLINGIDLSVNGKKLAWSVKEYLDTLGTSGTQV
jgi:F-type H+-transporting ATPase subunit b